MDPCVFCRILAGELPASLVLDNDLVAAFLDIHPWNPGHTLVLPRRHVESFTDLNPNEVEQLALCVQRIAAAMKRGLEGCEAITLSLADGGAAGCPLGQKATSRPSVWSRNFPFCSMVMPSITFSMLPTLCSGGMALGWRIFMP